MTKAEYLSRGLANIEAELARLRAENEELKARMQAIIERAKLDPDARAYELADIARGGNEQDMTP